MACHSRYALGWVKISPTVTVTVTVTSFLGGISRIKGPVRYKPLYYFDEKNGTKGKDKLFYTRDRYLRRANEPIFLLTRFDPTPVRGGGWIDAGVVLDQADSRWLQPRGRVPRVHICRHGGAI